MSLHSSPEAEPSSTSYQKAFDEWSERLGSARAQARHWQWACLGSFLIVLILLLAIIVLLATQKNYVYVAEVKPQENVVSVVNAKVPYVPSLAEKEHFVSTFIQSIMSLPLDPVVARDQWLDAYADVTGAAVQQLNAYAQANDPFTQMGLYTKTVEFKNYHPLSQNSYEFTWTQTTYDREGQTDHTTLYNGIFTLVSGATPKNTAELLKKSFGT